MNTNQVVKEILRKRDITTWYQPIVDLESNRVSGWEALTRGPSVSPLHAAPALLEAAEEAGVLKALELECARSAIKCFEQLQLENKLFINLSSEVLIAGCKLKEQINDMIFNGPVPDHQIVIELTGDSAAEASADLIEAIAFFKEQGFEIAMDGQASTWAFLPERADIHPNFMKIDRHMVHSVDRDEPKQALIRALVATARSIHAKVIAVGVETLEELYLLQDLGVSQFQGSLFQRPKLSPLPPRLDRYSGSRQHSNTLRSSLACDLVVSKETLEASSLTQDVMAVFEASPFLQCVALVEGNKPVGIVTRADLQAKMSRRYRKEISLDRPISGEMNREFLQVDSHFHIEQVSHLVTSRARVHRVDHFVITSQGAFLGLGNLVDLLRHVTHLQLDTQPGVHALTLLPGHAPIGDHINAMLEKGSRFTIASLDLNHFAAFNDRYGYAKGDELLIVFADVLRKHLNKRTDFVGHLGGHEFVLVTAPNDWKETMIAILHEFKQRIAAFYSSEDHEKGGIAGIDSQGDSQFYPFVMPSIGATTVDDDFFDQYPELRQQLIRLKRMTKKEAHIDIAHTNLDQIEFLQFDQDELIPVDAPKPV